MKKNSAVEDIFQNDNSNKNKTKTILLLTIVAIILISVFLIIAWVMTRDNPIQTIGEANPDLKVLNQQPEQISDMDNTPKTIPYAHNLDSNVQPNFPLNDSSNQLGLNLDVNQGADSMSSVPPVGVQLPADTTKQESMLTDNTHANVQDGKENYEDDKRYQAALRDLEQKHNAKGNNEKAPAQDVKQPEAKPALQPIPEKVITPLAPKETTIATAPDPTVKKTVDHKDAKPETKNAKEASKELNEDKKSPDQSNKQSDIAKPKEEVKQPVVKAAEPDKQKSDQPVKPDVQVEKPKQSAASDKVIQRSQNVADANQGKAPEKGHYIQVGSFAAQDQDKMKPFLNKIAKYNYRKLEVKDGNSITVKYLIGPYKTREEAKQIETKMRTEINNGAFHYEVK